VTPDELSAVSEYVEADTLKVPRWVSASVVVWRQLHAELEVVQVTCALPASSCETAATMLDAYWSQVPRMQLNGMVPVSEPVDVIVSA
jgi:hypothetical protein